MPKRHTTCSKLSFFCNLCQFTKTYVTNFVQSQFWWIVDCDFNGIRHIFIQSFVLGFMGLIRSELYCLGIGIQKKLLLFRSRINYIRLKNLIIKKLPEQNFHALSFISKRSFICCGSLINFVVVAVFINCSNS